MRSCITLLGLVLYVFVLVPAAGAQEDAAILDDWRRFSDAELALYKYIAGKADGFLDSREERISGLSGESSWQSYRASVRERLADAFGPLPGKTPLNPRVTGTFEHEGITVENVLFESRPGLWVTAALFRRTDLNGPLPAVVYVCGHTADGYRSTAYQHVMLNLARKGFAVLGVDPIGQGERIQYYDTAAGASTVGGPTSEHSYAGLQYLPIGRTMAMVRLWDCIRAVDYLHTRDDIDTTRIGVHGRSGGGTMSAFLGAMDERITAAAPECYITSFRRLFQSIGPQDAEQNLLSQISGGLDHGDFLIARAPDPTLVVATTRDFFSIQGVHETVRSVRPAFAALGAPGNIGQIEDPAPHQSTLRNRERVYRFFMDAFGVRGDNADEDIPYIDPQKLQVTETGQVVTAGSRHIHEFIVADAAPYLGRLVSLGTDTATSDRIRRAARERSGYRRSTVSPEDILTGTFNMQGYTAETHIIVGDSGIPLPSVVYRPGGNGPFPAVLLMDPAGKRAVTGEGSLGERLAKEGWLVWAVDLPGRGEMTVDSGGDDSVIGGVSLNLVFGAQLIGESVTGIEASAVSDLVTVLGSRDDCNADRITVIANGITGPAALHAAALDSRISSCALVGAPSSWASLVRARMYDTATGSTIVPSALLDYDLPNLAACVAPRHLLVAAPTGGDGAPLDGAAYRDYADYMDSLAGTSALTMIPAPATDTAIDSNLMNWLRTHASQE